MTGNTQNQWAQWLLHRRFGGDLQHGQAMLQELAVWRDRIFGYAPIAIGSEVICDRFHYLTLSQHLPRRAVIPKPCQG